MAMWLFRGLMLAALVAFLWALSIKHGWLPPRTDEQREALALIEAPSTPANAERNAFAAVWFLAYDLPAERLPALMAADVARAEAMRARGEDLTGFGPDVPEGVVADTTFDRDLASEDTHDLDPTNLDANEHANEDTHDPDMTSPEGPGNAALGDTHGSVGTPSAKALDGDTHQSKPADPGSANEDTHLSTSVAEGTNEDTHRSSSVAEASQRSNQDTHDSPPPLSPDDQLADTHESPTPQSRQFEDTHHLCGTTPHCLNTLAPHSAPLRALLTQHAPLLARYRALSRFDELRSPLPASVVVNLSTYDFAWRLDTTAIALDFLDGQPVEALAALCHQAGVVRNLRARTDLLVASAIGARQLAVAAQLYADMRARAPADLPVPEECAAAFAPLTEDEFAQCDAMKREFAALDTLIDTLRADTRADAPMPPWLLNRDHARARLATRFAPWCAPTHAREIFERRPMAVSPPRACSSIELTFDAYGCWLGQHAVPDFSPHYHRLLDLDALLRAVNIAQWLNARDPATRRADFLARPMAWRTDHHEITLAADGDSLHVDLLTPSAVFPDGVIVPLRPLAATP